MNELGYLSLEDAGDEQGFRTILVTNASHPYVAGWWPPGHIIGYEHEFTHAVHSTRNRQQDHTQPRRRHERDAGA